ncbi:MAG TPA: cob(I)yrinic acid a,c-diamide adenosyltransferase [Phycisphaerales bacterium]|nr:cob(I)yrinic acid a,c-diamide adenosyltransferase [Phycisphaerales bacterium]
MKLYTRTGDDGSTGLFGGQRVGKDHPRVNAYGTVDELNACIGLAAAACDASRPLHAQYLRIFSQLQSRLFDIGADLATPEGDKHESKIMRITDSHVSEVEAWIDAIDGGNAPMKSFVLPGGTELAARLHLARTVCRRAERLVIALGRDEAVSEGAVVYLNRVSDLLFAMARRANADAGVADIPWTPGT